MHGEGLAPNKVTFLAILSAVSGARGLEEGRKIHTQVVESGYSGELSVGNALIDMYSKCGSLEDARKTFAGMDEKNGLVSIGNAIVHMYGKCGNVADARKMFDKMRERDTVSWTTMIAVYAEHGYDREALQIFKVMLLESVAPDKVTLINVLDACSNVSGLAQGRLVYKQFVESGAHELDLVLGNAVARMFGSCGSLREAREIFESLAARDVVSWNCLITAYAQHGSFEESLRLFRRMLEECVKPDEVTFVGVLSACSHGGLVADGCQFFVSMVQDYQIPAEEIHYGCMVDLLGRAGRLAEAEELLSRLPCAAANDVMWTSLLSSCKLHSDLDRGKRAAKKLLAMVPGDPSHLLALATIHAASGEWKEAMRIRKEVMERGSGAARGGAGGMSRIEVNGQVHKFVV
ncbi:hypothetical protein SELMODRAFT_102729 [Selaginella moellendorffii]|uniref:Pentacotripeptide-repeat region of PRORP domain-containing protein n=1 Tax=Selaginella moellendorffii TaxID=88036 RepID=D8RV90_SELML|nr:hypothetical protein SELMODRAFT_102729 [Selaginella moellendorffii]